LRVLQPATATWKRLQRGLKGTLYSASKKLFCQITIRFITIGTTKRWQGFLKSSSWISCTADHNPRMIAVTQKMLRVVLDRQAFQLVSLGETSASRLKKIIRAHFFKNLFSGPSSAKCDAGRFAMKIYTEKCRMPLLKCISLFILFF